MTARVRKDRASVYANVGIHADIEISLKMVTNGEGAQIEFGRTGPDLIMDIADLDSMERSAAVAAEGARQMREQITENGLGCADRLAGAVSS